jgi:pyruvate/2-oxoglutarate dehydrogenase complex dihydrolipoamide acyltransferase (E2) component
MADTIDVRVPDIGDFKDVPVIEVLVKPGDAVKKNDSIVTLESDKASMEVPSPVDGTVQDVKVKIGDKVSEGSVILTLASVGAPAETPRPGSAASTGSGLRSEKVDAPGHFDKLSAGSSIPHDDTGAAPPAAAAQTQTTEQIVELKVPDIGDFKDVPVIEVMIEAGDTIAKDASIVTLESDKASMEVPASAGGGVADVRVKVGDKV